MAKKNNTEKTGDRRSGESKYYPKNTTFYIPKEDIQAEIYWQTKNANHILENYRDMISQYGVDHDLKFSDFKYMVNKNSLIIDKGKNKFTVITFLSNRNKYYKFVFSLQKRFNHYFAVIVTAYVTKNKQDINAYKAHQERSGLN